MKSLHMKLAASIILAFIFALSVTSLPAQAADINVDCGATDLISAINTANANGEADTLNLAAGCDYSFASAEDVDGTLGDSALPRITTQVVINGNGATIERAGGSPAFRLLRVATGGDLTLDDVTISGGNSATRGGGIYISSGTLTVTNSTLSGNNASGGGGIYNIGGTLTMTNSTLSGNSADDGGGIFNNNGTLTVTNSTISGNSASNAGGGIANLSTLTVINSTLSGNSADSGGGVYNEDTLTVTSSTISGNSADDGGGIFNAVGTLTVTNSIVWGNSSQISGSATISYSIVQGGFAGGTNISTDDPLFVAPESFANAPTTAGDYHIAANSPAIDAGNNTAASGTDIDGEARILYAAVDIGSDEVDYCPAYVFPYIVPAGDEADFVRAVTCANANPDASTINLTAGTYNFATGDATNSDSALPRITTDVTINGSGATIARAGGSPNFRLLYVAASGSLTLDSVTVTGGSADDGGGIRNDGGTLTVTNSTLSGNSASSNGGGIYNSGGTPTVTNSTLSGNSADDGGGIYNFVGTLTMTNSTLSGNSATDDGGGIFNFDGTLTVTNSTIAGNSAEVGGGIYNGGSGSALTVTNSIVWGNDGQISGSATVSYSIIEGWAGGGTGNSSDDPLFVAPEPFANAPTTAGDYHIGISSPAIDAGNSSAVPPDTFDVDGDTNTGEPTPDIDLEERILGAAVDIGADEVDVCGPYVSPYTVPAGDEADFVTAVHCANANPDLSVINLTNSTYSFTTAADTDAIYGDSALPRITTPVIINGSGATITRDAAAPNFRLLHVASGGDVEMADVSINNGISDSSGGGIYNRFGALTITDSTISGNESADDQGGGVYSNATLNIVDSLISGNHAGNAGGILNSGTLSVVNSIISGNSAQDFAGGIWNVDTATISNSTISGNTARIGGGILSQFGILTLTNSTISGNSAIQDGGGIMSTTPLDVVNSLITGNRADSNGGGIISTSTLTVTNSTLSGNYGNLSGGGIDNDGTLTVTNSIVWGNNTQLSGSATVSYSIIEGWAGGGTGNSSDDPLFVAPEPFANAPTTAGDYHIGISSPAIDAGNSSAVPPDTFDVDGDTNTGEPTPDIDGDDRILNGTVDLGADEIDVCLAYPFPYTVAASDEAAFVQAIRCANANPDLSVINLTNSTYSFIAVTEGSGPDATALPSITTPVVINGNGATIARAGGSPAFRLLRIASGATLTLDDASVTGGQSNGGGGILNAGGTVTVTNSTISSNSATSGGRGGGILSEGGTLTVTNSTISGNSAIEDGGGIASTALLEVVNSLLTGNQADSEGGGIYNTGTLDVFNSTIAGNSSGIGGGIANRGAFTIVNSIVWGNSSQLDGDSAVSDSIVEGWAGGGTGNSSDNPQFVDPRTYDDAPTTAGDYHIGISSPAIDAGSSPGVPAGLLTDMDGEARIQGAAVDIGADENGTCAAYVFPYTVPAGDEADFVTAVACANANPDASTINLTNSTYSFATAADNGGSSGNTALPRITTPVVINGSGATIARAGGSPGFRLLRIASGGDLTLDSATVTGGSVAASLDDGGAIFNDGTLTVTNSTLSGNNADRGGGIFNDGTLTVTNSTLSGNGADSGGGIFNDDGTLAVNNSTLSGNNASIGGGIANTSTLTVTVTNSTLSGNSGTAGGSIYSQSGGTLTVLSSTIAGNSATFGGGIENSGTLTVTNSTLADNNAVVGGGIANTGSGGMLTVTNSTLSGNSASDLGGGIANTSTMAVGNSTIAGNSSGIGGAIDNSGAGTLTVANSIVWGNSSQISGSATVSYSIVEGWAGAGTGNLDVDPLFVAPEPFGNAPTTSGDYRLQANSPALNMGNNAAVPADAYDVDGDSDTAEPTPDRDLAPRIVNTIVDMGAYEHQTLAGIAVDPADADVSEVGTTDTYTVVLLTRPTGDVTITPASGGQTTVDPVSLVFTSADWDVPQTVTVTAIDDPVVEGTHSDTIGHTAASADAAYDGLTGPSVSVTIDEEIAVATELLANGGFELHTGAKPENWTVKNPVNGKVRCNANTLHTGSCGFRFKKTDTAGAKLRQKVDFSGLTFETGQTLTLSLWIRDLKGSGTLQAKIKIAYAGSAPQVVKQNISVAGAYQQVVLPPAALTGTDVESITVMLTHKVTRAMAIDDVSLLHTTLAGRSDVPLPPPGAPEGFRGAN